MKKNKVELDDENKIQNVFDYLLSEYDYAHINKIDVSNLILKWMGTR